MTPPTHHLSQKAFDRLKAEHDELITVGRVDIARKIEAARELGDLKENGDYHAAKDFQGLMEARIRQLAGMIENCEIVEGTDGDMVEPGSVVELRYEGDDDTDTYFYGSVEERGVEHDIISPGSPLGKALVGKKPGDKVDFDSPTGATLTVEVVSIA
jgi:transcription elongation factor GreA